MQHEESANSKTSIEPTQVAHPWRATARTATVATVALLPLLPEIARAANIETIPAVASTLVIVAALQRVLTLPGVEAWMNRYLSWLSAEPYQGTHRKEDQ